jgi:hypothetical protein
VISAPQLSELHVTPVHTEPAVAQSKSTEQADAVPQVAPPQSDFLVQALPTFEPDAHVRVHTPFTAPHTPPSQSPSLWQVAPAVPHVPPEHVPSHAKALWQAIPLVEQVPPPHDRLSQVALL